MTAVPVVRLDRVLHVGDMDPASKRPDSHEGSGLSVSLHPGAWRSIARGFVSGPCWELRRDGGAFLDAHRVRGSLARSMLARCVADGLAAPADLWRVAWWDDEAEERRSMTLSDRDAAFAEAACMDAARPRRLRGLRSTPALDAACGRTRPSFGDRDVLDLALPLLARRDHGLDGVWWSDRLDPLSLSAPRGVIAVDAVADWTALPLDRDPDDGDEDDDADD